MIRVTLGNNKQYDYIHYYCVPNQIGLTNKFEQTEYYPYDSIKKIEKQVKDLTLEECEKLRVYFNTNVKGNFDAWHYEDFLAVKLSMNDYIDITSLVKGIINNGRSN